MKWSSRLTCLALMLGASHAQGQPSGRVYDDQLALVADAIRDGHAQGVMRGAVADMFRRQFQATGPLRAEARVIKALPEPDCKRLEIVMTQTDAVAPQGRTDAVMTMQLNICADGSPPSVLE